MGTGKPWDTPGLPATISNREVARATLEKKFEKPLKGYEFPPQAYVRFECMSLLL